MNVLKIHKLLKCNLQRAYSGVKLHNRSFTKCTSNRSKESTIEVQDAGQYLSDLIKTKCKHGSLFAGTGQYYKVPDHECVVLLNFEEDFLMEKDASLFDTIELVKLNVHGKHVDDIKTLIATCSNFRLYHGELDTIDVSQWHYGFTVNPFSIFSGDERIVFFMTSGKDNDEATNIHTIHTSIQGATDVFDVSAIKYVGLFVSAEPFNERSLVLGMHDESDHNDQLKVKTLISVRKNEVSCDLGKLTMETEWLMKAAAMLCKKCQQSGNEKCHLQVSSMLLPDNNPYVAMRQKKWLELIQKHPDI